MKGLGVIVASWLLILFVLPSFSQEDGEDIIIGKYRTLYSNVLKEQRRILVHLPDGYEGSNDTYPVLYKLDAINLSMFAYNAGSLYRPSRGGEIPKIIFVSLENTDRNRDMFPAKGIRDDITPGADNFLGFIEKELIPFVEEDYRTTDFRLLMGESNSAMFAVYAFLEKPELFNGYIASSPELNWCYDFFREKTESVLQTNTSLENALFLIHGENDNDRVLTSNAKYVEILESKAPKSLRWKLVVIENEGHVPKSSLIDGLHFIFEGYELPESHIQRGYEAIEQHYSDFSKKLGSEFKVPAIPVYSLGLHLLGEEKYDEAIAIFNKLISNYSSPREVALGYMGLAEAYIGKGDKNSAKDCYKKIIEIKPELTRVMNSRLKSLEEK